MRHLSEHQAWAELATHMEHSEQLPTEEIDEQNIGICDCLYDLYKAGLIGGRTLDRMEERVEAERVRLHGDNWFKQPAYLWKQFAVPQRLEFCKRMAKETEK